jgi:hypothetical protein
MTKSHTSLQRALTATREALASAEAAPRPARIHPTDPDDHIATIARLRVKAAMLARLVKP